MLYSEKLFFKTMKKCTHSLRVCGAKAIIPEILKGDLVERKGHPNSNPHEEIKGYVGK